MAIKIQFPHAYIPVSTVPHCCCYNITQNDIINSVGGGNTTIAHNNIIPFFYYNFISISSPYLYRPPSISPSNSLRFLLYFQILFSQSYTYSNPLMLFISFDYYCYLYDFAALLKIENKLLRERELDWIKKNPIHSQVVAFVQKDHVLLLFTLTHTLSFTYIIISLIATRVLFNFQWSQLAMFLSWKSCY